MASSGIFRTDITANLYTQIEWSIVSQDIANNTSIVRAQLYLGGTYGVNSTATKNAAININGDTLNVTYTIGNHAGAWKVLAGTHDVLVGHGGDGTRTVAMSAWIDINITFSGTFVSRGSASGTAVLDTIPRSSVFSSIPASCTTGTSATWNITRYNTGFTHQVKFTMGSYTSTVSGDTSVSFAVPHSWFSAYPDSDSGSMTVELSTYYGAGLIGKKTYTVPVALSTTEKPSISNIVNTRLSHLAPTSFTVYVQNKSRVSVSFNAYGIHGSTIVKREVMIGSKRVTGNPAVFDLPKSGSNTITCYATDSRGRVTSSTSSIFVYVYSPPTLAIVQADRCLSSGTLSDEGTYVRFKGTTTHSSVASQNSITRTVRWRLKGATSWYSSASVSSGYTYTLGNGYFSPNNQYEVEFTATDTMGTTVTATRILSTAFVTMDFLSGGHGIAMGKVASVPDTLDLGFHLLPSLGVTPIDLSSGDTINDKYDKWNFYRVRAGCTGSPTGAQDGFLMVQVTYRGAVQYWHEDSVGAVGRVFRRIRTGSSWTSWKIIGSDAEWQTVTLLNSWAHYSSFSEPGWRINGPGIELKGMIRYGAQNTVAFTIPTTYFTGQFSTNKIVWGMGQVSTNSQAVQPVRVDFTTSNGNVTINTGAGTSSWISIDGTYIPFD